MRLQYLARSSGGGGRPRRRTRRGRPWPRRRCRRRCRPGPGRSPHRSWSRTRRSSRCLWTAPTRHRCRSCRARTLHCPLVRWSPGRGAAPPTLPPVGYGPHMPEANDLGHPGDQVSLRIAAPPARVYGIVTDIANMGRLSPECIGGSWLGGRHRPRRRRQVQGPQQAGHRPLVHHQRGGRGRPGQGLRLPDPAERHPLALPARGGRRRHGGHRVPGRVQAPADGGQALLRGSPWAASPSTTTRCGPACRPPSSA